MKNDFDQAIQGATKKYLPYTFDWRMLKALLYQESRLNPRAVSPAGAHGIAQFMPKTWADVAPSIGCPDALPFDVVPAINGAAFYLAQQINKWKWPRPDMDRLCLAMASYNAGFGNIEKAQRLANGSVYYAEIIAQLHTITSADGDNDAEETRGYVSSILGFYNDLVLGRKSRG